MEYAMKFIDANSPGVVYEGTAEHMDGLSWMGGCPVKLSDNYVGPIVEDVQCEDGKVEKMEWEEREAPAFWLDEAKAAKSHAERVPVLRDGEGPYDWCWDDTEAVSPPADSVTNPVWDDDNIQFPRLIAELEAVLTPEQYREVAESMDLDMPELMELFERARKKWDAIKAKTTGEKQ
jgi:hypothetical protein